jgi:hypothetical protein
MNKPKSSLKRTIVTNTCILGIIALVYLAAFGPVGSILNGGAPVLKGSTGENVVGLQIVVDDKSDVAAYIDTLERYNAKGTFFFSDQQVGAMESELRTVMKRGHGVGYYISEDARASALYIGGGYSIPVMSSTEEGGVREVCPSIDVSLLSRTDDWAQVLSDTVAGDMFLYIRADNNLSDFEKVVQIVVDKGYTILKVSEML